VGKGRQRRIPDGRDQGCDQGLQTFTVPDEVVLATGPEMEVRIARADIAEMRPGMLSVMPQGLDTQLSKQELADLITFLKSMR